MWLHYNDQEVFCRQMKFGLDNLNPAAFGAVQQARVQSTCSAHDRALLK
jgi:hypothetical protein